MNPATQSAPRTAPGSHNPTFEEENPIISWCKENKGFLALLGVVTVAGLTLNMILPRMAQQGRTDSWELFNSLTSNPIEAFSAENLENTLAQARDDDRIHHWVVLRAINYALAEGDGEALDTLRAEFDQVSGELSNIMIPTANGPAPLSEHVSAKLAAGSGQSAIDYTNPATTGEEVKLTLKLNESEEFSFTIGLYPDVAPLAVARFLEAVRSGRMLNKFVLRSGSFGLSFPNFSEDDEEEELSLESKWGYFHHRGVLTTQQSPEGGGIQNPTKFDLNIMDAYHQDGRTTVFGMLTEGMDQLENFDFPGPNQPDTLQSLEIVGLHVVGEPQPEPPADPEPSEEESSDDEESAGEEEEGPPEEGGR